MAWFGKKAHDVEGDDTPTGQIPAQVITDAAGSGPASPEPVALKSADDPAEDSVEQLRGERSTLIHLCLYALDRARSGGVVERLEEGLAGIGVTAMRPDGQKFDPAVHEAGGTVPTADGELDGVVAETEVVGFCDGGTLLRAPIVIVYARKPGGEG
ncbi:MAG: nucleotide exchange factor GrpE [Thermocrispum sp.]